MPKILNSFVSSGNFKTAHCHNAYLGHLGGCTYINRYLTTKKWPISKFYSAKDHAVDDNVDNEEFLKVKSTTENINNNDEEEDDDDEDDDDDDVAAPPPGKVMNPILG